MKAVQELRDHVAAGTCVDRYLRYINSSVGHWGCVSGFLRPLLKGQFVVCTWNNIEDCSGITLCFIRQRMAVFANCQREGPSLALIFYAFDAGEKFNFVYNYSCLE